MEDCVIFVCAMFLKESNKVEVKTKSALEEAVHLLDGLFFSVCAQELCIFI